MPIAAFAAALAALALLSALPAAAGPLQPERAIEVSGDFAGKPGKTARDVSGLACRPPAGGDRRCVLIDNESRAAQFARLTRKKLHPGAGVPLIGTAPSPATLGRAPAAACARQSGFEEFDGEGVAYAAPYFYVTGSHGCARADGAFQPSAFLIARFRVDGGERAAGPVELSWRASDLLSRAGEAAPYFGKALDARENGLNIEGIAVAGDRLWLGLRAPALDGRAFLVGASLAELFAPGAEPAQSPPVVVAFPAGAKRGVRDLSALADGRLVVLVGPAQEQDAPYALLLVDPVDPAAARELGELRARKNAKAEAVTVLAEERDELRLLVGYDGVRNGEFEEYRVKLR